MLSSQQSYTGYTPGQGLATYSPQAASCHEETGFDLQTAQGVSSQHQPKHQPSPPPSPSPPSTPPTPHSMNAWLPVLSLCLQVSGGGEGVAVSPPFISISANIVQLWIQEVPSHVNMYTLQTNMPISTKRHKLTTKDTPIICTSIIASILGIIPLN